jgi:hypothetical protein
MNFSGRSTAGDCSCSKGEQGYQPFPQEGKLFENLGSPLTKLQQRIGLNEAVVYCYVIDSVKEEGGHFVQKGSAPNFQGDVITLCTCKHHMRTSLSPNDWEGRWVAGFTGIWAGGGKNALVYLMKVSHAFESHYDLWYSEDILPKAKRAKSARISTYGDLFEPIDHSSDPFDPRAYRLPHEAHSHTSDNEWYGDVDRTGYGGRRAALLVGDPQYSFLWDRPTMFFPSSIGRGYRKIILNDLLSQLQAD